MKGTLEVREIDIFLIKARLGVCQLMVTNPMADWWETEWIKALGHIYISYIFVSMNKLNDIKP